MSSSRLQLNSSKSEVIWLSTSRMKRKFQAAPLRMGKDWISPSVSVRNLGAFFDSDMRMSTHVSRITQSCFSTLRQIKTVASSLPPLALNLLITSLVFSKLDYCNSTLVGLPKILTHRLQSVVNAAARLLTGRRRCDHITPVLQELHWLNVRCRIIFKVAQLVFKCLNCLAPSYLMEVILPISNIQSRGNLRSASSALLFVPSTRLKSAGDRSFPAAAAKIWNSLPLEIRAAPDFVMFKKELKQYLMKI